MYLNVTKILRFHFVKVVFFAALFISTISHAHDDHDHDHGKSHHHHKSEKCCSSDTSSQNTNTDPEAKLVEDALETFHEAVEGDHTHSSNVKELARSVFKRSTMKKWVQGFNFKEIGINSYRAYKIKSHIPGAREHALNLVFMIPMSHMLEVLSGPIASAVASEFGASPSTVYGLGTLGAILSIPGIDPLCILIFSTYPLKPMQSAVTFFRKGTFNIVKFTGSFLGLTAAWKFLSKTEDPFTYLENTFSRVNNLQESKFQWDLSNVSEENQEKRFRVSIKTENQTVIEMHFNEQDGIYLEKVTFGATAFDVLKSSDLSAALKPFNWNIRDAVKKAFNEHGKNGEARFYVQETSNVDGFQEVVFKPHAVPMPKKITFPWLSRIQNYCERLLR